MGIESLNKVGLNYNGGAGSMKASPGVTIVLDFSPAELGIDPRKAPPTIKLTEEQAEKALFRYFGLNTAEAKKRLGAENNPFDAIKTSGSLIATYNKKTGKYEIRDNVEKSLYQKLSGRAKEIKRQIADEKKAGNGTAANGNEGLAGKRNIDNTAAQRAKYEEAIRQNQLLRDANILPSSFGTKKLSDLDHFTFNLPQSSASNEDRALSAYIESRYGGGNLFGDNKQEILALAKRDGVRPRNLQVNGNTGSFDLSVEDQLKIHRAYIGVQEKVNNDISIWENIANNNPVADFIKGLGEGAWGAIKSNWEMITNPIETLKGIKDAAVALSQLSGDDLKKIFNHLKEAGYKQFATEEGINSLPKEAGKLIGMLAVELALGKGAGLILKGIKGIKGIEMLASKADDLAKLAKAKTIAAFSDEAADIARASAKQRLRQMSTQLNSGFPLDPGLMKDLGIIAGNKLKNGAVKFADFSRQMIQEFGDDIRPKLEKLYRDAMEKFGRKVDEAEIKATDVKQIARRPVITASNVGDVVVPSVRTGEFASWFNSLSKAEMDVLWSNKALRSAIEDRLRHPGGFHEWLPVSKAPKFREWGVKAEQIWDIRTKTGDVKFVNPAGFHGGLGSGTAHREIFALIDQSSSFADFKAKLRDWASRRLEGGANALPEGLR